MGKLTLRPTIDQTYVIDHIDDGSRDSFYFRHELELSRQQEKDRQFERACNTRFLAFQKLIELMPDDETIALEWENDECQAAIEIAYNSAIDHFLVGDWEMCAGQLELLLELDPEDHMEATIILAYAYIAMQEFESFDEVINDVNDKYIDKAILTLWSEYRRTGKIVNGELVYMRKHYPTYYAEFVADDHLADEQYLADISSERPSKEALARELWFRTEHLWITFPGFIESLKQHHASLGR